MTRVACRRCRQPYEGERQAGCPACQAARWLATPELIRPKHAPEAASRVHDTYRSILTPRTRDELAAVLDEAARAGLWFFDRDYGFWVHVTHRPLGRAPGVGIPAGRSEPDHALDCLFIAEAESAETAHVFAADAERHRAQVRAGVFEPLGVCTAPECSNLRIPGRSGCEEHGPGARPAPVDPASR